MLLNSAVNRQRKRWSSAMFSESAPTLVHRRRLDWHYALIAFGWNGERDRGILISDVLLANDFFKWHQLTGDPAGWDRANELSESELELLRNIIEIGRQRPRSVIFCAVNPNGSSDVHVGHRVQYARKGEYRAFVMEIWMMLWSCCRERYWALTLAQGVA